MTEMLRVGIERVPITPPIGIRQVGFFARDHGAEYLLDDLYATALVLDNAESKLALVACDLLYLHPTLVARIRQEIARRTDILASHVMFCCSHTHSGPIVYAGERQSERDRAYLTNLVHQVAGAVCAADGQRQPARVGYGRAEAHIGINRREQRPDGKVVLGHNPTGPVDPEVLILRLDSEEGYPLAVIVNYACHAVALGSASYGLSADWPGAMRWAVEQATGATCCFLQGACADINPRGGVGRDYARVQRLGQAVAGSVLQAWAEVEEMDSVIPLAAMQRGISLPLRGPLDAEGNPIQPVEEIAETVLKQPWTELSRMLEERFPWQTTVRKRNGVWHISIELQAFQIGKAALAAVPAEPFVEVGLQIKARSPFAHTLFAGYSNGCVGYLPVPSAYEIGGYEVDTSFIFYHLPAPLAPACAQLVEKAMAEMLKQLGQGGQ